MITERLCHLCEAGDMHGVRRLLDRGANPNFNSSARSKTALHVAAEFGRVDIVDTLLQNGAFVDPVDKFGFTPLMLAAIQEGSQKQTGISRASLKDQSESSLVVSTSYRSVIQLLLQHKADVSARDHTGNTLFHIGASLGTLESLFFFFEASSLSMSKIVESKSNDVKTSKRRLVTQTLRAMLRSPGWGYLSPLHYASDSGRSETVSFLLNCEGGCDPNAIDVCGWTALHWAAKGGHAGICLTLLNNGASASAKDFRDMTPSILAKLFRHFYLSQMLSDAEDEQKGKLQHVILTPVHSENDNSHSEAETSSEHSAEDNETEYESKSESEDDLDKNKMNTTEGSITTTIDSNIISISDGSVVTALKHSQDRLTPKKINIIQNGFNWFIRIIFSVIVCLLGCLSFLDMACRCVVIKHGLTVFSYDSISSIIGLASFIIPFILIGIIIFPRLVMIHKQWGSIVEAKMNSWFQSKNQLSSSENSIISLENIDSCSVSISTISLSDINSADEPNKHFKLRTVVYSLYHYILTLIVAVGSSIVLLFSWIAFWIFGISTSLIFVLPCSMTLSIIHYFINEYPQKKLSTNDELDNFLSIHDLPHDKMSLGGLSHGVESRHNLDKTLTRQNDQITKESTWRYEGTNGGMVADMMMLGEHNGILCGIPELEDNYDPLLHTHHRLYDNHINSSILPPELPLPITAPNCLLNSILGDTSSMIQQPSHCQSILAYSYTTISGKDDITKLSHKGCYSTRSSMTQTTMKGPPGLHLPYLKGTETSVVGGFVSGAQPGTQHWAKAFVIKLQNKISRRNKKEVKPANAFADMGPGNYLDFSKLEELIFNWFVNMLLHRQYELICLHWRLRPIYSRPIRKQKKDIFITKPTRQDIQTQYHHTMETQIQKNKHHTNDIMYKKEYYRETFHTAEKMHFKNISALSTHMTQLKNHIDEQTTQQTTHHIGHHHYNTHCLSDIDKYTSQSIPSDNTCSDSEMSHDSHHTILTDELSSQKSDNALSSHSYESNSSSVSENRCTTDMSETNSDVSDPYRQSIYNEEDEQSIQEDNEEESDTFNNTDDTESCTNSWDSQEIHTHDTSDSQSCFELSGRSGTVSTLSSVKNSTVLLSQSDHTIDTHTYKKEKRLLISNAISESNSHIPSLYIPSTKTQHYSKPMHGERLYDPTSNTSRSETLTPDISYPRKQVDTTSCFLTRMCNSVWNCGNLGTEIRHLPKDDPGMITGVTYGTLNFDGFGAFSDIDTYRSTDKQLKHEWKLLMQQRALQDKNLHHSPVMNEISHSYNHFKKIPSKQKRRKKQRQSEYQEKNTYCSEEPLDDHRYFQSTAELQTERIMSSIASNSTTRSEECLKNDIPYKIPIILDHDKTNNISPNKSDVSNSSLFEIPLNPISEQHSITHPSDKDYSQYRHKIKHHSASGGDTAGQLWKVCASLMSWEMLGNIDILMEQAGKTGKDIETSDIQSLTETISFDTIFSEFNKGINHTHNPKMTDSPPVIDPLMKKQKYILIKTPCAWIMADHYLHLVLNSNNALLREGAAILWRREFHKLTAYMDFTFSHLGDWPLLYSTETTLHIDDRPVKHRVEDNYYIPGRFCPSSPVQLPVLPSFQFTRKQFGCLNKQKNQHNNMLMTPINEEERHDIHDNIVHKTNSVEMSPLYEDDVADTLINHWTNPLTETNPISSMRYSPKLPPGKQQNTTPLLIPNLQMTDTYHIESNDQQCALSSHSIHTFESSVIIESLSPENQTLSTSPLESSHYKQFIKKNDMYMWWKHLSQSVAFNIVCSYLLYSIGVVIVLCCSYNPIDLLATTFWNENTFKFQFNYLTELTGPQLNLISVVMSIISLIGSLILLIIAMYRHHRLRHLCNNIILEKC